MSGGIDRLMSLPRFRDKGAAAYQPGLKRMTALLSAMGDPHLAYPVAHVAGTNGKGSTASMIAAIGTASGRKVGLHTSPHLIDITERMRVDGVPAPTAWLEEHAARFAELFDDVGPSFFEATVALSLLFFADEAVDAAVVEVGLGGRLDATNIVRPGVCVITSIGLEHTDVLGDTYEQIAREKAGIIKPGVPVVSGVPDARGGAVIREVASLVNAPVLEPEPLVRIEPGLVGPHQRGNAALAEAAAMILWPGIDRAVVDDGLRNACRLAGLRARLEEVAPGVFADVSHNADGIEAAIRALRERYARVHVIMALMEDKDAEAVGIVLRRDAASVRLLDVRAERLRPAADLLAHLMENGAPVEGTISPDGLSETCARLADGDAAVLAAGSHVVAAEVLRAFG